MYDELPSFGICAWAEPKAANITRNESKASVIFFMIHLLLLSPE
jgi:hypothetical protein